MQVIEDFTGICNAIFGYHLIEEVVPDHAHKCTGNTVPGAIYNRKYFGAAFFREPVEIAAHNIFWFIKDKGSAQPAENLFLNRQDRFLNSFGIFNAAGNLPVADLQFFGPFGHFMFKQRIFTTNSPRSESDKPK